MVFYWRERREAQDQVYGVEWAFSDRRGGVGKAPFDDLNLARHVGDRPEDVQANRQRLARAWDGAATRTVFMDQHHGATIARVGAPRVAGASSGPEDAHDHGHDGDEGDPPSADALMSGSTEVTLAVMVADCVPVLLADRGVGLVAAVHAGRPGMMAGIVDATVSALVEAGATHLEAVVGPSVCPRCYEVPEQMRAEAAAVHPAAFGVSRQGTPAVDVAAAVVSQLREAEVAVTWLSGCTREEEDLFSYRREGETGRFVGLVRLLSRGAA